jgi:glycosyltransferase involved in cell wall biosynthesis
MHRHIEWAVDSGIEVCVADYLAHDDQTIPGNFRLTRLLSRQTGFPCGKVGHRRSELSQLRASLRLKHIAAVFQPDVVHSYLLGYYTSPCLQAGLHPLVVSAWGSLNRLLTGEMTHMDDRWLRRLRAGAHTLVVDNPNMLNALDQRSLAPLQAKSFPIGVDGSLFHPDYPDKAAAWRFVLDIPPEAIVLLSPRGWSKVYGQYEIMQAFAQAQRQVERPLILVFRGVARIKRPEALARQVLDLGASLGVGHAIRWIPDVPYHDLPGIYNLADIVLNYPLTDAFPSTLLEAAACARPIITSDLPAYRNTFIERCCTLVTPQNPTALANAIVSVVNAGPAAWSVAAQRSRASVLAEHTEATQRAQLLALYRQVAEGWRHPAGRMQSPT